MSTSGSRLAAALADRYRIERELGQGGMATVYLAEDVRHSRQVAIKVLHEDLGAALGAERFLAEIKTTARLQHPHILPLLDSGSADGLLFYVMPYVTGETLRARLERERQLPLEDAVRITREVADALGAAHTLGVIHRDIKPENILLQGGHALVADFGIALAVQQAGGQRMTQTGLSLGTPQYMSPEQAMGERAIDARSDIYALGAVTYEMLVGEAPFTGPTVQAIVARLITEEPRRITAQRKAVPEHVEAAVLQALEKLPADRFESAAAFGDAMGNASFARARGAQHGGTAGASPRRVSGALVPMTAVALIATVAALWGWMRPAPARPVARYQLLLPDSTPMSGGTRRIAMSPDGLRLIYRSSAGDPATGTLWVRERDDLGVRRLVGTDGAQAPFVSPNGESVAYFAGNALWTIPVRGGSPVMIATGTLGENGGSWGADDVLYVSGAFSSPLLKVRAAPGSVPEPFTHLDSASNESGHASPEFLPSGKGVVFVVRIGGYDSWEIAVADVRTGTHRRLTKGVYARYARSGHLLIVAASGALSAAPFDERSMRMTGAPVALEDKVGLRGFSRLADLEISRGGTLVYSIDGSPPGGEGAEPVWVERDGRAVPLAPGWTSEARFPSLSPDGRLLAVSIADGNQNLDVWVRDLERGTTTKVTHDGAGNWRASWLPDSRGLLYLSNRNRLGELFRRPLDGSDRDSLVLSLPSAISEAFTTADGEWLVYRVGANAAADLYAQRLAGDPTPVPLATSEFLERGAEVSPDGRYLAYTSNETNRDEVYLRPFPRASDDKWLVSTAGGLTPLWSRDGKELFYRSGSGDLVAVEVTSSTPPIGRQRVLFSALPYLFVPTHRSYDVTGDGRRFLMLRRVGNTAAPAVPLVVVENFFEELKAREKP